MKSILISIKPRFVAKILNGEKTIEIRKTKPNVDLPIDVYIYCTNDKNIYRGGYGDKIINGKVVAKFTLKRISNTYDFYEKELLELAQISDDELFKYLGYNDAYAWHIDDLVIFDKPKELNEFYNRFPKADKRFDGVKGKMLAYKPLTKAPQSWCYVEI